MVALLLITAVAVGHFRPTPAQGARSSNPPLAWPASASRLFDIRSYQAWQLVQKRLNELGFAPDRMDRAEQVMLTKWREVGAKGMEWLPAPLAPMPYVAKRVRFEVFVSPFAEPAHVYVGSLMEATDTQDSTSATAYNMSNVNTALMGEIAKALGADGVPIPANAEHRRKLALSVLGDGADDCLRHGWPKGGKITPPRKISISEFEVIYPAPALKERIEGSVQVEFTILEDGAVTGIRLLGPPLGGQLEASAIGAASLLLYRPAKMDDCRIPAIMTYTVRYRR
jgi:TonB family protein